MPVKQLKKRHGKDMVNRLTELRKRLSRYIISAKAFIPIILLTLTLTIFTSVEVQAQNPNSNLFNNPSDNGGNIVYAPIMLDGRELLHIAARRGISNNLARNNISPLQIRVRMYEDNLSQILSTGFNPKTLYATPAQNKEQTVILVGDTTKLKRRKLMSVTDLDAQLYGLSVADLASEFSKIIPPALIEARQFRQRESIQRIGLFSLGIIFGFFLFCLLLLY